MPQGLGDAGDISRLVHHREMGGGPVLAAGGDHRQALPAVPAFSLTARRQRALDHPPAVCDVIGAQQPVDGDRLEPRIAGIGDPVGNRQLRRLCVEVQILGRVELHRGEILGLQQPQGLQDLETFIIGGTRPHAMAAITGLDRLFPIGAIAGQVGGGHQSSRLLHESLELPGEWPLVEPVGPFRGEGPKGPGEIGLANTGPKPEWDPAPDLHAGGVQAGK